MTTRLSLPPIIDLPATLAFADTLRATLGPVLLNGAAVERIGVAGIQLVLSAQVTAQAAGTTLGIEDLSDALRTAILTTGAQRLLASER